MNIIPLLQINNLRVSFDQLHVLSDVSLRIPVGSITALMGPNGSGKSTILKALFGLVRSRHGEFLWRGERFHPSIMHSHAIGISYVPQGRQLFCSLSVRENIEMGGFTLHNPQLLHERIVSVLELFPMLRDKMDIPASDLSGGQQQMVALARGLVTDPKLLLLDEPTLGLSPKVVSEVFHMVEHIRNERGITILVVEHNVKSLLRYVDQGYILRDGTIAWHGTAEAMQDLQTVEEILLA